MAVCTMCFVMAACGSSNPHIVGDVGLREVFNSMGEPERGYLDAPIGADGRPVETPRQKVADDVRTVIVYYDARKGKSALLKAARKYGSKVLYEYRNFNAVALSVPAGKSASDAVRRYERVRGVVLVALDQRLKLD